MNELARSVNAMLDAARAIDRRDRERARGDAALRGRRRARAAHAAHFDSREPRRAAPQPLDARSRSGGRSWRRSAAEQRELVALLDALQALARGDAGAALPREQLDFAEVVDAAVEAARRRHPEARIELSVARGARSTVDGWPDGLRLLVDNLIENAVRHGGSTVRVDLAPHADGESLLLSVEDDGPGIPSVEREHIFERFQRGSGAVGPGSGLGLALVAQQASLHGGSVEVGESALGGASFEVAIAT